MIKSWVDCVLERLRMMRYLFGRRVWLVFIPALAIAQLSTYLYCKFAHTPLFNAFNGNFRDGSFLYNNFMIILAVPLGFLGEMQLPAILLGIVVRKRISRLGLETTTDGKQIVDRSLVWLAIVTAPICFLVAWIDFFGERANWFDDIFRLFNAEPRFLALLWSFLALGFAEQIVYYFAIVYSRSLKLALLGGWFFVSLAFVVVMNVEYFLCLAASSLGFSEAQRPYRWLLCSLIDLIVRISFAYLIVRRPNLFFDISSRISPRFQKVVFPS